MRIRMQRTHNLFILQLPFLHFRCQFLLQRLQFRRHLILPHALLMRSLLFLRFQRGCQSFHIDNSFFLFLFPFLLQVGGVRFHLLQETALSYQPRLLFQSQFSVQINELNFEFNTLGLYHFCLHLDIFLMRCLERIQSVFQFLDATLEQLRLMIQLLRESFVHGRNAFLGTRFQGMRRIDPTRHFGSQSLFDLLNFDAHFRHAVIFFFFAISSSLLHELLKGIPIHFGRFDGIRL
mmetsp:Transcript_28322/g.46882  ORF Transcript_28322/g.46882 Transcript_28322/m.46882 type:complete len:235 (+) Transcript_28322:284-988(+)